MELKNYMVGIDMGSGGCKVTIVNIRGEIVANTFREYPTYYPNIGWAEQKPEEWLKTFKLALKEAMVRGNVKPTGVASIATGGSTHTFALLDHKNEILRPAIVWTDKRSINQVDWLNGEYGPKIFDITLHRPNPHWTLPKLLWIKENEGEIWEKVDKLFMPKDYIRQRLTGIWATDWMDAHGTLLFDVPRRRWSEDMCNLAGIPRAGRGTSLKNITLREQGLGFPRRLSRPFKKLESQREK